MPGHRALRQTEQSNQVSYRSSPAAITPAR